METNITNPATQVPALPQNVTSGLPNATLCDIGFYSFGGRCVNWCVGA